MLQYSVRSCAERPGERHAHRTNGKNTRPHNMEARRHPDHRLYSCTPITRSELIFSQAKTSWQEHIRLSNYHRDHWAGKWRAGKALWALLRSPRMDARHCHAMHMTSNSSHLSQHDVSDGRVDVVASGATGGDHVAVLKLHGLGTLRSQLAADDDLKRRAPEGMIHDRTWLTTEQEC